MFKSVVKAIKLPLIFLLLMLSVHIIKNNTINDLVTAGILPRNAHGLAGIIFSPFIHGSNGHLFANSIPFLVLSTFLFYFYLGVEKRVYFSLWLLSGAFTWLIGRGNSFHIGASGWIYGIMAFLFISGLIRKNKQLTIVSLIVAFYYGGMIWGVLPYNPEMSWEGHLSGIISGLILAIIFRKSGPKEDIHPFDHEPNVMHHDPYKKFDIKEKIKDSDKFTN